MPIETESDEVPDDVTIEITDLDFDQALVDLPPPPPGATDAPEEEILEFWISRQRTVDGLIFDISALMCDVVYETCSRLYYLCNHKSC